MSCNSEFLRNECHNRECRLTETVKFMEALRGREKESDLCNNYRSNIMEAYGQLNSLIKAEYSPEDIVSIGLPDLFEVQSHLDGLH